MFCVKRAWLKEVHDLNPYERKQKCVVLLFLNWLGFLREFGKEVFEVLGLEDVLSVSITGMQEIITNGVHAEYLRSAFPTHSWPNWVSLATGE